MQKICYVLFLCPLLLFTACGGGSSSSTGNSNNADTSDYRLQRSDNGAELLQSIKAVLLKRYGTVITDDTYTDGIYETTSADEGAVGSADVSITVRGMFIRPEQVDKVVKRHPEILKARLVVDWQNEADQ
ncbi:MAG: hypothetical protein ACPG51_11025, partial [Thiolinea sp.]